jgi:hypothetical protein
MTRTKIRIEFQKGDTFEAELFDDEAPKTVAILKQRLPFEYTFFQSIVSGHALVCLPPISPCRGRTSGSRAWSPAPSASS